MKRLGKLDEPWVCPPSLRKVFAKRAAIQQLRRAKGAAIRAERELREAIKALERLK